MKKNDERGNRWYGFCGEGAGVPGLPHVISEDEAREAGLIEQVLEAVRAGTYRMEPNPPPLPHGEGE